MLVQTLIRKLTDSPLGLSAQALPAKEIPFHKFRDLIYRDPEKHGEYIRLMGELMVLAFQTDTTRVCTLAVGDDGAYFPGVITVGYERHCHTLEHQGNSFRVEDADPISREACRDFALTRSWDNSARQFISNVSRVATGTFGARRAA